MTESQQMATKPKTVKVLVLTVTETLANTLFAWSNVLLIAGAAAVLIGTIGAIAMGSAKEQFANERISTNEAETARAKADAETAKEGAAKANARTEEARLELEKFKAPRKISEEMKHRILSAARKHPGQKFSGKVASSVPDALALWFSLSNILTDAGWKLVPPKGLATGNPPAGIPVAPYEGITLFVPYEEIRSLGIVASDLMVALNGVDGRFARSDKLITETVSDNGNFAQAGVIAIEIGIKPE
jgi:hypothetical protein